MKILQVIPHFNPHCGGDVNVCYHLSQHLANRGHEVTIFTTDFEFDETYANSLSGVRVVPFHCFLNIQLFLYASRMKKELKKEIKNFDIIHVHDFRTYQNAVIHRYAKKFDIPYILQAHGDIPIIIEKHILKKLYDLIWGNKILRDAATVIAVSKTEVEQYIQFGVNKNKIVIIPNGIDIKEFKDLPVYGKFRKGINIKEDYLILYLGRIHKIKGIDFLIKSFSELIKEVDNVKLVIVGPDGGYKIEIEKLVTILNLNEKVKFIGYVNEKDKSSAYVDADLLVYPSIFEIFGLTPFEAIMCDTPVIVTDDCGCGEKVREANCGYLVKYGDGDDLKEKMKLIIENPLMGSEMIKNGRNYIHKNLAWDTVIRKFETVYSELKRKNC